MNYLKGNPSVLFEYDVASLNEDKKTEKEESKIKTIVKQV